MAGKAIPIGQQHAVVTIKQFFGMVTDQDGVEMDGREFTQLINTRNTFLKDIRKRSGCAKDGSISHSLGTSVLGGFTFTDASNNLHYLKMSQNGHLYIRAPSDNSWTDLQSGFATTTCWFAQLDTKKTGASASTTGTLTNADYISITDSAAAFTINTYVGFILNLASGENKLVSANNATQIFSKERFDDIPSGSYNVYPRQREFFLANGTNFYKCDGTTLTRLDNVSHAYAFTGITSFTSRIFGWTGSRLHWSDAGVGENFSRNAWRDFLTDIEVAQPLQNTLIIYEKTRITSQAGDSPDNYTWTEVLSTVGTSSPKSVATYQNMQFFLNPTYGVCLISADKLSYFGKMEPLSVSQFRITNDILNHTSAELTNACAEVHLGKYYLCVGSDVYVLHIIESMMAPRDDEGNIQWIWTKDSYPSTINPNTMFHFDQSLIFGSNTTGQCYTMETGNTDDGTAIAWTVEKKNWMITPTETDKTLWSLKITQNLDVSSITMNAYFASNEHAYQGSPDKSYDLSTETQHVHDLPIPIDPTNQENKGYMFSFKLTESGSSGTQPITRITLLFDPDILY